MSGSSLPVQTRAERHSPPGRFRFHGRSEGSNVAEYTRLQANVVCPPHKHPVLAYNLSKLWWRLALAAASHALVAHESPAATGKNRGWVVKHARYYWLLAGRGATPGGCSATCCGRSPRSSLTRTRAAARNMCDHVGTVDAVEQRSRLHSLPDAAETALERASSLTNELGCTAAAVVTLPISSKITGGTIRGGGRRAEVR